MAKLTINIGAKIDQLKKGLAKGLRDVKVWGKKVTATTAEATKTKPVVLKVDNRKAKRKIQETKKSFGTLRKALTTPITFRTMITGMAGIAAAIGLAIRKAVQLSAAFEQTRISFNTMLGDADKAKTLLDELIGFSTKTPFTPDQVLKAGKTLLAFGFEAKDVTKTMRVLGDISAGTGKDLSELSVIFGQIKGAGRLMGQDLLQLINAGFNPLNIIADKTGKSMLDLRKDMEKGLISFDQVNDAFKTATSEGGLFFNLMEKQSKSLNGRLSTLKGSIEQLAIGLGNSLMPIIKPLTEDMIEFAESATDIAEAERTASAEGTALNLVMAEWLNIVTGASLVGLDFNDVLKTTEAQAKGTGAEIEEMTKKIRKMQDAQKQGNTTSSDFIISDSFGERLESENEAFMKTALGIENDFQNAAIAGDEAGAEFRASRDKFAKEEQEASFNKSKALISGFQDAQLGAEKEKASALQKTIGLAFQPGGKIQSRLARIGGERTINVDRQIPQKQLDQLMDVNKNIKALEVAIESIDGLAFPGGK